MRRLLVAATGPAGRLGVLGVALCAAAATTGLRPVQVLGGVFLVWCLAVATLLRRGDGSDAQGVQDP